MQRLASELSGPWEETGLRDHDQYNLDNNQEPECEVALSAGQTLGLPTERVNRAGPNPR